MISDPGLHLDPLPLFPHFLIGLKLGMGAETVEVGSTMVGVEADGNVTAGGEGEMGLTFGETASNGCWISIFTVTASGPDAILTTSGNACTAAEDC